VVGIELPSEDRLPPGPARDLVEALHQIYRGAGRPGLRRIAKAITNGDFNDTVSHEAVSDMLNGKNVPRWSKLECVVRQLADWNSPRLDPDITAAQFLRLWDAASGLTPATLSQTTPNAAGSASGPAPGRAETTAALLTLPEEPVTADGSKTTTVRREGASAPQLAPPPAMPPPEQEPAPARTDRWRLTYSQDDAPGVARLGQQGFDHPAYGRTADQIPLWVRIGAVVACDSLGDALGWQELRARFAALLAQQSIRGLVHQLTDIPNDAHWRPRGTPRRSWLEADLASEDQGKVPAASALLFLPEGDTLAGLQPGCAQLILHIDFAPVQPTSASKHPLSRRPPYWRDRFEEALALPGELAAWLTHRLGLQTSDELAAHFGIMLQAKQSITEMVDPSGIPALSSPWTANQFTGWVVADANGRSNHDLASQMMLDLSERVLHLDGPVDAMSGLAVPTRAGDPRP
jgi:hypothetical protein